MTSAKDKIMQREQLAGKVAKLRKQGKKVGFTNGVFDILHAGHVDYLERAKQRCDYLVVSLNTDESVKKYKDPARPLVNETDRAGVVAALECVDFVTFHSERRMRTTLEIIKPTYYIKGGDYTPDKLTSKDVVEKYGGEALILPLKPGISTSEIIDRALMAYCPKPGYTEVCEPEPAPAVFLDRDGVINVDHGYVSDPADFELLPGAVEGMKKFREAGYFLVIVTNQGGINLGYYSKEDFFRVNLEMLKRVSSQGIIIDKIYFCPHTVNDNCNCRKPNTGMVKKAQNDLPVIMEKSILIGDKETDIQTGKAAGVHTCLIGTREYADKMKSPPDWIAPSLEKAADIILSE